MPKAKGTLSDSSLSTTASANFEDPLALGKQLVELIGRLIDEADPEAEKVCVEFALTAFFNDPKKPPVRHRVPGLSPIKNSPKDLPKTKSKNSSKVVGSKSAFSTTSSHMVDCKMDSDSHVLASDGSRRQNSLGVTPIVHNDSYLIDVKMDSDEHCVDSFEKKKSRWNKHKDASKGTENSNESSKRTNTKKN